MPIYSFKCKKCEQVYEELTQFDESDEYPGIECPECGSKRKVKLMSCPNFKFSDPIGTDRWVSDSQGHDYRHNWNMEHRVAPERKRAEEASHMGPNPYTDTTEQDIQLDGKILDRD